jgi:hypothetical protein
MLYFCEFISHRLSLDSVSFSILGHDQYAKRYFRYVLHHLYIRLIVFRGVILRHEYLAASTQSQLWGLSFPEGGILISYLPLAHIYEVRDISVASR